MGCVITTDLIDFIFGVAQNTIAGLIILLIGWGFYKRSKRYETKTDAQIKVDIKVNQVVREFKKLIAKETKPLTSKSFSTASEIKATEMYQYCQEITDTILYFDLKEQPDIELLKNYFFHKKGVLYCNNPTPIENEAIPLFQQINKMKSENIIFENDSELYLRDFNFYQEKISERIKSGEFLKKYW